MNEPLITAEHVSLILAKRTILTDISLSVKPREIVTLIGPNGAGKTSLLRVLLGLCQPTKGAIHRKTGLTIGYMPQKLSLDATLPIKVHHFLRLAGSFSDAAIMTVLTTVQAPQLQDRSLYHLSAGEMQRVLLARAILRQPELLVLDEPAQGVDVNGQLELYRLLVELRDKLSCAILMVSHDLHLVMAATDTVICLNHHVCCHGHPDLIRHDPAYLALFGQHMQAVLAFYTHHHDHKHDE